MKKILSTIFLYIVFSISVIAASTDILDKIENDLYGFSYANQNMQTRVARLEKSVYGKSSQGDLNKRIAKLSADISADVIGLEIKPSRDTFLEEEKLSEDSSVNYPVIDEIEQKLFNTTYKSRDLHTRIVTIEKKLFGKIYDVDDYSKRMDRIKAKVYPLEIAYDESNEYINDNYNNIYQSFDNNHKKYKMPFGQRNYTRQYANYGDFAGIDDNLSSNNINDDLTQMEYDMFGTEFSSDDTQTRIKRLNSVNKAQKSKGKYDSQKFSQRMSTAMEIGAMILMILAMVL